MRSARLVALPALVLAGGCGLDRAAQPAFLVVDSSGIEVVRTRAVEGRTRDVVLGDVPLLRLGSEEPESPELFGQINSLHFGPDGSLWVVDLMSAELRGFSVTSGAHRFTVGGRGEGPGEFGFPVPVGFDPEGRAWIWDQRLGRLTVVGATGELIEVRPFRDVDGMIPRLIELLPDGTFVARLPEPFTGALSDGMVFRDSVRLWRLDGDGSDPELLVERAGATWYYRDGTQAHVPFSEGAQFGTRGDRIVFTESTGAPVLDVLENGTLVRRIHLQRAVERVTPEAIERDLEGGRRTEAGAEMIRSRLSELPIPEFLPTWAWVRLGPAGHVFALRHGTVLDGEVWDVFDPSGRFAGTLTLAGPGHLMDIGEELLAVLELDELGVPGVAVFAFDQEW